MADIIQSPFTRLQYNNGAGLLNPLFVSDIVANNQMVQTLLSGLSGLGNNFGIFLGFSYTAGSPGTYGPGYCFMNGQFYYMPNTFNENQTLIPNVTLTQASTSYSDGVSRNMYAIGYAQIGTAAIGGLTIASGGTGYGVGDIVGITQSGASGGTFQVTSVSAGVITGLSILQNGQNYSVASGLATSAITGSGTGATVNITSVFQSATFATGGNMNTYRYDNKSLKTPSYGWSSWVVVGSGGGAPSYTSGFTAIGGGEPTEYRKDTLGNVQVYGNCSNNSPTNNYCFVLPVGYRPTVPYYFIITEGVYPNNSGPVTYAGYVDTNGHVVVDTNSGGTIDIAFSVTFPTA